MNGKIPEKLKKVTLLGHGEKIKYRLTDNGLRINTPDNPSDKMAIVFKVELK